MIVCACGAPFEVRRGRYVCATRRRKGTSVCTSSLTFDPDATENVFLDALEATVRS
ncbi:MAG: hypothetical protein DMF94_00090 [Acidobacteria bacterium]|nr:MAG: hypothetical protein DMF96_08300 [Acidobacteriota bacterium]PYR23862.1 MAG: hypothetical protein DMF94_00090 [Acidobacteriota bacterium]